MVKELLSLIGIAIAIYAYVPYFRGIWRGETKPHVFSWFLWGVLTGIGWAAQYAENAGPGAWITGFTSLMCLIVAVIAFRQGEKNITTSDWVSFIAALCSIPLWYITKDPLWAVILITVIDALAFYPTFRKSWHKPEQEVTLTYTLSGVKFALALPALENFTLTTALYPASLVVMNFGFVAMVLARRKTETVL
ncbi:MAG: hypothetical protein AB7G80_03240 [Dongiaceae bacterium]